MFKLPDRDVRTASAEAADPGSANSCHILGLLATYATPPFLGHFARQSPATKSLAGCSTTHVVCLRFLSLSSLSVDSKSMPQPWPHLSSGNILLRHTICFKASLLLCKLSRGQDALWRSAVTSLVGQNLISSTASFLSLFRFLCFNPYSNSLLHFDIGITLPFSALFISLVTININHHHV